MPASATILVGSGINPRTVGPLLNELLPCGLREVHLSGGGWTPSNTEFRRKGMDMGVGGDGEWAIWLENLCERSTVEPILPGAAGSLRWG